MIYLDSSVALAAINGEPRLPPKTLWDEPLVASRLTEYEVRVRTLAGPAAHAREPYVEQLLAAVSFVEITPQIVARLYEPFPVRVRTLDAIHLATLAHLARGPVKARLATYDQRLSAAAARMGIELVSLD